MTTHTTQSIEQATARWVRESHRRQFKNDEDYQQICREFLNSSEAESLGLTSDNDEIWSEVESAPHPTCQCGFCATADWK